MTISESAVLDMESKTEDAPAASETRSRKKISISRAVSRAGRLIGGVRSWSPRRRLAVFAILGLLIIGLGAATGVAGVRVHSNNAVADAKRSALAAANENVPKVLSYKFDTAATELEAASQLLTGAFADDYIELTKQTIIPAAQQAATVTNATVVASAVVDGSEDSVTVLLFLNQSTTSKDYPDPKLDSSRVRVELESVGDRWLISSLTPV